VRSSPRAVRATGLKTAGGLPALTATWVCWDPPALPVSLQPNAQWALCVQTFRRTPMK